jgi:hypothetical protein
MQIFLSDVNISPQIYDHHGGNKIICHMIINLNVIVSVVGIATGYGLDDQGVGVGGSKLFSSPR